MTNSNQVLVGESESGLSLTTEQRHSDGALKPWRLHVNGRRRRRRWSKPVLDKIIAITVGTTQAHTFTTPNSPESLGLFMCSTQPQKLYVKKSFVRNCQTNIYFQLPIHGKGNKNCRSLFDTFHRRGRVYKRKFCMSVFMSVCLSVCLSNWLSVCLSLSFRIYLLSFQQVCIYLSI